MRMGFGLIGLLAALALVAALAKKQLGAARGLGPPAVQGQTVPGIAPAQEAAPSVRAQSQQFQQQVKQQMDALMQQPRSLPEE